MRIDLSDLTIKFQTEISDRLTEDWTWLIGTNKKVILVSAIGDMFLTNDNGNIFWLDVGQGKIEMVAADKTEFERKLTDIEQVNEWFMKDGQIYSYKKLPVIGGDYSLDNFGPLDIEVHFRFAAEIHRQIKDLPDGTKVNIKFVD